VNQLMLKLWKDDCGALIATEWVFVATILVLGAITGLVAVTAGHAVQPDGAGWHVPKKELVGALQVLLQSRRLQVARSLPMSTVLVKELEKFRVKITPATNETFEA
jgi:hypothetical protein